MNEPSNSFDFPTNNFDAVGNQPPSSHQPSSLSGRTKMLLLLTAGVTLASCAFVVWYFFNPMSRTPVEDSQPASLSTTVAPTPSSAEEATAKSTESAPASSVPQETLGSAITGKVLR
ncbi:hypothetical protein [Corynebacterium epidermidicanis]|uniref:hypothetical protein n=1 Tax=Corynebacterium epidermidicanis TaxID=1050174 RepID=UPI0011876421|nr:hypothetical protein [Corynebacterium epidermidicanis]